MPGTITRNGNSILGTAAMSGVRRAAFIESAAMARCTTRKSVHQYLNDSTNPRPITIPNHSTPIGFAVGPAKILSTSARTSRERAPRAPTIRRRRAGRDTQPA